MLNYLTGFGNPPHFSEKKLYNYIMMPAMLASWLFGVLLIHTLGFSVFAELWMQIKVISVVILTFYHYQIKKQS